MLVGNPSISRLVNWKRVCHPFTPVSTVTVTVHRLVFHIPTLELTKAIRASLIVFFSTSKGTCAVRSTYRDGLRYKIYFSIVHRTQAILLCRPDNLQDRNAMQYIVQYRAPTTLPSCTNFQMKDEQRSPSCADHLL